MGNGGKIFGEVAGGNNGGKKRRTTSYVRLCPSGVGFVPSLSGVIDPRGRYLAGDPC